MRHQHTAPSAEWPKPNKWNPVRPLGFQGEQHERFADALNGRINRPLRKGPVIPPTCVESLNFFSQPLVGKGPELVIEFLESDLIGTQVGVGVTLEAKIVDYPAGIKRQCEFASFDYSVL